LIYIRKQSFKQEKEKETRSSQDRQSLIVRFTHRNDDISDVFVEICREIANAVAVRESNQISTSVSNRMHSMAAVIRRYRVFDRGGERPLGMFINQSIVFVSRLPSCAIYTHKAFNHLRWRFMFLHFELDEIPLFDSHAIDIFGISVEFMKYQR
jgi:hypothetical protein